jgi:hypothetical protein
MQEVPMLVSLNRLRSTQLALFDHPLPEPDWRELSPETQQNVVRLLSQLLRQHGSGTGTVQAAEEGCNE